MRVFLYDTTLRDGEQREGMSFTLEDKLKIAEELDRLGIPYIEGGFPGSNQRDMAFFHKIKSFKLKAKLVAFGSTRRRQVSASEDINLQSLLKAETSAVCLVGKTWDLHVTEALRTTLDENLRMIFDSISYMKKHDLEVIFDAEHFFDGYRFNPEYTLKTIKIAEDAGADWIVLCDTNGGSLPSQVEKVVSKVRNVITTAIGIHAHNDTGCAVANSLAAVQSGATQVQGTANGYGERCGNANLFTVAGNLVLKMKINCLTKSQLSRLAEASHYISEIANVTPDNHQPYVGRSAFAHKAGLHVDAVSKRAETYEHINPELVGNSHKVLISRLAGKSSLIMKAKEFGLDLSSSVEEVQQMLKKIKQLEKIGYQFEAADGSFELLLRRSIGQFHEYFQLESFRVVMEKRAGGEVETEATIKLRVGEKRMVEVAEGNGPVNALDLALRRAISRIYPYLDQIELTDYKVRVLDAKKGTGAVVRVLIETTDGERVWGTIGVSENIIEASWQALADSINYGLSYKKKQKRKSKK
jgi:2-isopropylmalate synthase